MIEIIEAKQAEFDTFADESAAANRDAESEKNGVDVNQNVIIGASEGAEAGHSAAQPVSGNDPTATRPVEQIVEAPSAAPAEREIDNASINKIFADEKARILAKRQREAEAGITPMPAPAAPVPTVEPAPVAPVVPEPDIEPVAAPAPRMIFCRFCGKQISGDSIFCNYCGKDVR